MKKHTSMHLNDNAKVALIASGFLAVVMVATYLQWFA